MVAGPMRTFAEIWEQDARWLLGPGLLGDVIEFLRGRAPVVVADDRRPTQANFSIPVPRVRDAVSGEMISVYWAVPEQLRPIFETQCNLIARDWYGHEVDRLLGEYVGRRQMTRQTLDEINSRLRSIERDRTARGEDAELWEIAANRFGFSRWALPKPAGMAVE